MKIKKEKKGKKKPDSVLNQQRPKRKIFKWWHLKAILTTSLLAALITVVIYEKENILPKQVKVNITSTPTNRRLNSKVLKYAKKHLRQPSSLQRVAFSIHEKFAKIKSVRINKTAPGVYQLSINYRKPVAYISIKKQIFLIDTQGLIYRSDNPLELNYPLPQVMGVTGLASSSQNKIPLDRTQSTVVSEIVRLINECDKRSIWISKIELIPYRGFSLTIDNTNITAQVGRDPFSARIEKLHSIVIKLKKRGIRTSQIELDYKNKAFIKNLNQET